MSLGREINDFLNAWGKVDTIATSRSKRDYYANGGKRGAYDPNNPPPGWGGGNYGTSKPGLGRRITDAVGLSQPGGPSVGRQMGAAVGFPAPAPVGGMAGGMPSAVPTYADPQGDDPIGYDPDAYQQTYEGGGPVRYGNSVPTYETRDIEPPILIPPLPDPQADDDQHLRAAPQILGYPGGPMPVVGGAPASSPPAVAPSGGAPPAGVRRAAPAVGGAPPARLALNDERRTAAYDPELDGPTTALPGESYGPPGSAAPAVGGARSTPQSGDMAGNPQAGLSTNNVGNDLEAAINGGLSFAQKTFHLDNSNVAVGSDPHRESGAQALMQGVGAAPAQLVQAMDQKVNQSLPPGMNNDQLQAIRRLEAIYTWRSANGDKPGADKAAFELLQFSAGVAAKLGQQAVQQYQAGDVQGAQQTVVNAYNQIPDGRHLTVQGNTATVVDTRTGKPVQSLQFTPEQVLNVALGLSNRSLYWQTLVQRVSAGGKASNRSESQQELDHARADYYRARTGQVGKAPAGRGRGGAPAGVSPAASAIIDQLNAIPRPGGAPPLAPPQVPQDNTPPQGGGEPEPEDDEERALNAPPDLKAGSGEDIPLTTRDPRLRLKPPRPGSGSNPPPVPDVAGGGAPASSSAGGSRPPAQTWDGRPVRQNPDGSVSSELSITVTDPELNGGKPTNIPSLWGGQEVDQDTAIGNAIKSGKTWPSFGSIDEAVRAASARSNAKGRGENVGAPNAARGTPGPVVAGSSDPDAVPPQEIMRDGSRYRTVKRDPETPKTFDEPAPSGVPKELLAAQTAAVKLTAREGGPAVRQHIAQRIKEWNDYDKGWAKRKKDFEAAETKRVTEGYKGELTARRLAAKEAHGYNLNQRDVQAIEDSVNTVYETVATKNPEVAAAMGKPEQVRAIAIDVAQRNKLSAEQALRITDRLLQVDPENPRARQYKAHGIDPLGNVVVEVPNAPPLHLSPHIFKNVTGSVKERLTAAEKAKADAAKQAEKDARPSLGDTLKKTNREAMDPKKGDTSPSDTVRRRLAEPYRRAPTSPTSNVEP